MLPELREVCSVALEYVDVSAGVSNVSGISYISYISYIYADLYDDKRNLSDIIRNPANQCLRSDILQFLRSSPRRCLCDHGLR
jgi:hypothetical protein